MIMSHEDIVREYKAAKTPMKQIGILADQNLCKNREIVDILLEAGCEVPKVYTKTKEKKEDPVMPGAEVPTNFDEKSFEDLQKAMDEADKEAMRTFEVPDSADTNIDYMPPLSNRVYIADPAIEDMSPEQLKQKLRDALGSVVKYEFEFLDYTKRIKSLMDGIRMLSQIYTEVDLSSTGSEAVMQTVTAFAADINLSLFSLECSIKDMDKIVANALQPQETAEDGE